MPCSSTGNTWLERNLIARFRTVYTHLCTSGAGPYLDPCTVGFACTLHLDQRGMQRVLTLPPSMVANSKGMALCARLYDAAAACEEMSAMLIRWDRKWEGQFWSSWAGKLCSDAEEANRREKILKEAGVCQERPVEASGCGEMPMLMDAEGREKLVMEAKTRENVRIEAREKSLMEVPGELRGLLVEAQRCVDILLAAYERQKGTIEAAGCERPMAANERDERFMSSNKLGKRPMGAHERDDRFMSSNKLGKRPMESNDKRGKRPMDADERDEMSMSANKRGKRPMEVNQREKWPMEVNKREKRPLEANEVGSMDQAVKKANVEQLEHIFACWRFQLDGQLDGSGLVLTDETLEYTAL
jgi:hypothetical protein